jgi:hypothetical protein
LPVPVSPSISTVTSEAATRPASANSRRIAVDRPHSRPKRSESASGSSTDSSSASKRTCVWPSSSVAPRGMKASRTSTPSMRLPFVDARSRSSGPFGVRRIVQ